MMTICATGNIGNGAEVKQVGSDSVCAFSIAVNKKIKGEKKTIWLDCSIWGNRAAKLAPYLLKGTRVAVTGDLDTHEHNGKTYLKVRVNEVDFMSANKGDAPKAEAPQPDAGADPDF